MKRGWWVLIVWMHACGPDTAVVELPSFPAGVQSWIVARVVAEEVGVFAADLDAPSLLFDADERAVELEVRGFESDLASLGLTPGRVSRASAGEFSLALPDGKVRFASELTDTERSPWREGEGVVATETFRMRSPTPCYVMDLEFDELPTEHGVGWAVNLDASTVLVGTIGQESYSIGVGRASVRVPWIIPAGAGDVIALSAFIDARGRLWIGDTRGRLWLGALVDGSLTLAAAATPIEGESIEALDGDPGDPEHELHAVTSSGTVARLDGGRWTTVASLGGARRFPMLAWVGPGDVLAGAKGRNSVVHVRGSGSTQELGNFVLGMTDLAHLAPGRIAVSVGGGVIEVFDDGRLESLGRSAISLDIKTLVPLERGFLYAGESGYFAQWDVEAGFCPSGVSRLSLTTDRLMPFGDGFLAIFEREGGREQLLARLTLVGKD